MKRVVLGLLVVGALAFGAWVLYWQRQLAPILDRPELSVRPTELKLSPPASTRALDLGYSSIELPSQINGAAVRHKETLFVSFRASANSNRDRAFLICPLVRTDGNESKQFLDTFVQLSREPRPSFFEFQKRILFAEKISLWSACFSGKRRTLTQLTLLAMKGLSATSAERIEIYENSEIGATVVSGPEQVFIQLFHKREGLTQTFVLTDPAVDAREVTSILIQSHRFKTDNFNEANLVSLLRNSGIPQYAEVPPANTTPTPSSR